MTTAPPTTHPRYRGRPESSAGPKPGEGDAKLRKPSRKTDGLTPWLFVLPTLLGIAVFYLWPMVQTVFFSFTKWGPFGGSEWTGLDNYVRLVTEPDMLGALLNTLLYAGVSLVSIPLAIYLAALINRPGLRFKALFRTLYFLPVITMPAAVAIVWRILFNGDFGVVNALLAQVGIQGPYWLSTPVLSIVAIAVVGVWITLGFNMIILGAGLQGIPPDLYEAAELDGAGPWKQFISITVPLLTPSIFFVTVLTVIGSFKVFDLIFVMMGTANPAMKDSQTLVYLFYNEAFIANDKGYAAAIGIGLLCVIAVATYLQFKLQKKWVTYV